MQKVTGTAVFPVRYDYGVDLDGAIYRFYTFETKLDGAGAPTAETVKTYTDMLGRAYKTVYGTATSNPKLQFYNNLGQLSKEVDPDLVTTLYLYNARGELEYTVLDVDQDGAMILGGKDRVTQTVNDVVNSANVGGTARRTRTYAWKSDGDPAATLVKMVETSADGRKTYTTLYNSGGPAITHVDVAYNPAGASRSVT